MGFIEMGGLFLNVSVLLFICRTKGKGELGIKGEGKCGLS